MSLLAINLRQLPTELLYEIAEYLSKTELVSLCRVSKLFNTVSTVLLYRTIRLREPVRCCKTLHSNVLAAHSVRSFTIIWCVLVHNDPVHVCSLQVPDSSTSHSALYCSSALYRTIYSTLAHLHGITTLDLRLPMQIPHSYLEGLQHCSFPNLHVLNLEVELTPSVRTFMRRNSLRIRQLYVSSDDDTLPPASLCTFRKLACFSGSFTLMPAFLPGSLVRRIFVNSFPVDDLESRFSVLSNITVPLKKIHIISNGWDLGILESLSRHAPRVLDIEFESGVQGEDMMVIRPCCHCRDEAAHIILRHSPQVSRLCWPNSLVSNIWTWHLTCWALGSFLRSFVKITKFCSHGCEFALH